VAVVSTQMRLTTQRDPEQKPVWPSRIGKFAPQQLEIIPVAVLASIPFRVEGAVCILSGIQYLSVQQCTIPCDIEQGLAQMKDTLHSQPELANGCGVAGFAIDAERA